MNLETYIDIKQSTQYESYTREQIRSFGIEHSRLNDREKIEQWSMPHNKKHSTDEIHHASNLLGAISLLFGLFAGFGLLSYSGDEPVNVIYFMAISIALPIVSMVLSIISTYSIDSSSSPITLSPAYLLERLLHLLPSSTISNIDIPPHIINWLLLKRTQLMSLLFSIGLVVALVVSVSIRDIAFGWSSTLDISAHELYSFLHSISSGWRFLFDWGMPSQELISQSRYFRLGNQLDSDLVAHASSLGEWWKFLLLATLFYAIFLRLLLYIWVSFRYSSALQRDIMESGQVVKLLEWMNTPIVSTSSQDSEDRFVEGSRGYTQTSDISTRYDFTLGWAMGSDTISVLNDTLAVESGHISSVGGSRAIVEDEKLLQRCRDSDTLLYVKAWEPPTMDIVDLITDLSRVANRVDVVPVGSVDSGFGYSDREFGVWERKMVEIEQPKVRLCKI